jgi:hypothetical protein
VAVSGVWPAAISRKEETRASFSAAVGGSPAMAAWSPRQDFFFFCLSPPFLLRCVGVSRVRSVGRAASVGRVGGLGEMGMGRSGK